MRIGRQKCANFRALKNDDFPDLKNPKISKIFLFAAIVVAVEVIVASFSKMSHFVDFIKTNIFLKIPNRKSQKCFPI